MITSAQCLKRYGPPEAEKGLTVWYVPEELRVIEALPARIYINKDMVTPLRDALYHLIVRKHAKELKTWDGCFNIRKKRGAATPSLHSWALAVDLNAAWNRMGQKPSLSAGFVECFKDAGFDWGGDWKTPDGMHFQLKELPK